MKIYLKSQGEVETQEIKPSFIDNFIFIFFYIVCFSVSEPINEHTVKELLFPPTPDLPKPILIIILLCDTKSHWFGKELGTQYNYPLNVLHKG